MTVSEASQRWNVSAKTILGYLADGLIYDITIRENQLLLPDIEKPKIVSKNRRGQGRYISDWMLNACESGMYVNAAILGISEDRFNGSLRQLEEDGYIVRMSATRTATNVGYLITEKGKDRLHHKKKTAVNITSTFNINANIGAGNIIV